MKKDQISVKQIVRQYLGRHGYDGLYSDLLECGCALNDLMPCDSNPDDCLPGYKVDDPSDEFDFLIVPEKDSERRTPDEWLKDPRFHGIRISDPDGWDRKNLAVDWTRPLTLTEMWEKVTLSTCHISFVRCYPQHDEVSKP